MMNSNASYINHHSFILTSVPGIPDKNPWMAFPLGFLYTLTFLGNGTILAVTKVDQSLHEPMYYFLSILALTDISLPYLPCSASSGLIPMRFPLIHASHRCSYPFIWIDRIRSISIHGLR